MLNIELAALKEALLFMLRTEINLHHFLPFSSGYRSGPHRHLQLVFRKDVPPGHAYNKNMPMEVNLDAVTRERLEEQSG